MEWKYLFKPHILERGYDYFLNDYIEKVDFYDNYIEAIISGSTRYNIVINFEDDELVAMECNCPHAYEGNNCKHMAAVLYNMDKKKEIGNSTNKLKSNIREFVEGIDEKIIKEFLIEILEKDVDLFSKFKIDTTEDFTKMDYKFYKSKIDDIFNSHSDSSCYIYYHNAYGFSMELYDFLDDTVNHFIENKYFKEAFDLINHIFGKISNQDIDDSDGGITIVADKCLELWEYILENCSLDLKKEIFAWGVNNLDNNYLDFLEEYIEDLLFNNFKESDFFTGKIELINNKISKYREENDNNYLKYYLQKWLVRKAVILKEEKVSQEIMMEFLKNNLEYSKIRMIYLDNCIENSDFDLAIKLLKEGKLIDNEYIGIVNDYRIYLKDIYKKLGKTNEYINEMWEILLNSNSVDFKIFKELKTQYSEKEWEIKREDIFLKLTEYELAELFKEEKLFDRLLDTVVNASGLYLLQIYEPTLIKYYPKEILKKYEIEVQNMSLVSGDRKKYRKIVHNLRKMKKYPEGKELVDRIIEDWKIKYNRRPAMMDELDNI